MALKSLLTFQLLLLLTLQPGVFSKKSKEISVRAGEMVALRCPRYRRGSTVMWTTHTAQSHCLTTTVSPAEGRVLLHGSSLIILSFSVKHQGNYSCSVGNSSRLFWFTVSVNTAQSRTCFSQTCYTQESCKLICPDVNVPPVKTPHMTKKGITWHKEGELLQHQGYLTSAEEKDHGVYTCTRDYLYHGQIFNMTFTVTLDVQPKKVEKTALIVSPHNNEVVFVDLGSSMAIDCKAVAYSDFDAVFWLSGKSFVDRNTDLPFYCNYKWESEAEEIKMTASLVFKKVSEDDLKRNYTCKLESVFQTSSFVTVTLAKKGLSDTDIEL